MDLPLLGEFGEGAGGGYGTAQVVVGHIPEIKFGPIGIKRKKCVKWKAVRLGRL